MKSRCSHTSGKSAFNSIPRKQDNGFAKLFHFYFLKAIQFLKLRCAGGTRAATNCALRKKKGKIVIKIISVKTNTLLKEVCIKICIL